MKRQTLITILVIIIACALCSCGGNDKKAIDKYEKENKTEITAAVEAMDGNTLALQDKMDWGMDYDAVRKHVPEPYMYDTGDYLSSAFRGSMPADENWKDKDGNPVAENFISTDILAYYSVDPGIGLYEYGYLVPDATLHDYDFLKAYYTNKYGEADKETWEWKNQNYEPTGKEDYYQMFADGRVKVVTAWDIEELNSVLVVDWLNDPKKSNNNFGQISFYSRTDGFSIDDIAVDEAAVIDKKNENAEDKNKK